MRRVVYVTYDGLEDQLGQSQVLPYLRGLASRGHRFDVVSFEKHPASLRFMQKLEPGIRWTALRYHKTPTVPATGFDMTQGFALAAVHSLFARADLIHVRALVPGAMVLPWVLAARQPLLFDTRALWPDEKVDVGTWPRGGRLYHSAKRVERAVLTAADGITVLTHALQRYLRDDYPHRGDIRAPIHVVPTCADLETFSPAVRRDPALADELAGHAVLAYVGSMGKWYLPEKMVEFYLEWRRLAPSARLLVISRTVPDDIREMLAAAGVANELIHRSASREQVAAYARCADASMCFILPAFSKLASAPTKLGELLGCGLPVVANVVGDMGRVLRDTAAGVVVDDMSNDSLRAAARSLFERARRPDIQVEARGLAERWFRLEDAVDAYDAIYEAMPRSHGASSDLADAEWPRNSGAVARGFSSGPAS